MGLRAGALVLVVVLAACLPVAPPEGITEQPLPPLAGEVAATEDAAQATAALAEGPEPEPERPEPAPGVVDIPVPEPAPLPPALAARQSECLRGGGSFTPRGGGLFACVRPTADAGRNCRTGGECQGLCLARSQTCAPVDPLYGCHQVLDSRGARQELCID